MHRENRENGHTKNPCQGICQFFQNTGNLVCSSCKFPDSKGKRYFNIFRKKFPKMFKAGEVCQVSFVYVIVTNPLNWHRDNLQSDRENTGNLKMQFEWVPCIYNCTCSHFS